MSKYPTGKKKGNSTQRIPRKNKNESVNSFLLRILLYNSPFYISGSLLADKLKMSRVAVWARVNKLREEGLVIEATRNKGYRIAAEPNKINKYLLEAWIFKIDKTYKIFVYDSIESTNTEAEKLIANGINGPFAVVANYQSAGRGRLGRKWYSPKSGNLNISIAIRPNVNLVKLRTLTLWQAIKIVELLRDLTGNQKISVKWPNDLVIEDKKLGGMLTEASIDSDSVKALIFGLGLNLNCNKNRFPSEIRKTMSSLKEITGSSFKINEITARLLKCIHDSLEQTVQGTIADKLVKEWEKIDSLKNRKVTIINNKKKITGIAVGINEDGSIKVKLPNSEVISIHSGEATIEK